MAAKPSKTKTVELILYIAEKSAADPRFGRTKLNKLLFYSDFMAYGQTGSSITGQTYVKLDMGPVLEDYSLLEEEIVAKSLAALKEVDYYGYPQKRLIALRRPNLQKFSGPEIAIVDAVIDSLREETAAEVSALSHRFPGWQFAEFGEVIPYETVFLSDRELTEKECKQGEVLASELGE